MFGRGAIMIELKRKFYDFLVGWKASKRTECLLVKGARQIGKTEAIRHFAASHYDSDDWLCDEAWWANK